MILKYNYWNIILCRTDFDLRYLCYPMMLMVADLKGGTVNTRILAIVVPLGVDMALAAELRPFGTPPIAMRSWRGLLLGSYHLNKYSTLFPDTV